MIAMIDELDLIETLFDISDMVELLEVLKEIDLPNHYLAGGSVTQAVWNKMLGNPSLFNIKDFDIVYFDKENIMTEIEIEEKIEKLMSSKIPIDIKNQAKVHEWYGKKFGNDIKPLKQTEDGIKMWLPCFAVGVRLKEENTMKIFSPYGLNDLANMLIRPNKMAMSKENYDSMNQSFKQRWPNVNIIEW